MAPTPLPTEAQWLPAQLLQQRLRQRLQVAAQQQGPLLLLPRVLTTQGVVGAKCWRMAFRGGAPTQPGVAWGLGWRGGRGQGRRPTCRARGRGATSFRGKLEVLCYVGGLWDAFGAVPPNAGTANGAPGEGSLGPTT